MAEVDTKVDNIESWWESVNGELIQLKKEMIERVVDKMKDSDNSDLFLNLWEDFVVDYLLDDWESSDKVNDFFIWMGINIFSSSASKLRDLRERIKDSNTKEDLDGLERSVIENLNNNDNSSSYSSSRRIMWTASTAYVTSQAYSWGTKWETSSTLESARVWEAKEVPLKDRIHWLFPQWVPKVESEMRKYITKIKVPIRTPEWESKKLTLSIHKKLANEYTAIFQEMYDKWIPVNPESTWWYNWRKIRRWNKLSHHSYWSAVDVNWDVNWWVYGTTDRNSPYYNGQDTVAIWKKHGFYRWWDWSAKSDDPMHFTYMNW